MPTIPHVIYEQFDEVAVTGSRYDDMHMLEKINISFDSVDFKVNSMDRNFQLLDAVINKINHAVCQFETRQDEFDHMPLIKLLFNSILFQFQVFSTYYNLAESQLNDSISTFKELLYPAQANSYRHYINDGDKDKLNEMIVMYLYRLGLFDIGDELIFEAISGLVMDKMTDARSKFEDMNAILDALRKCEIDIPLQWIYDNRERLGEEKAADLRFKVRVIKYTRMVEDANCMEDESDKNKAMLEALNYAKDHVTCFPGKNYVFEYGKLVAASILHRSNRITPIDHPHYHHFFDGNYKQNLIEEMEKLFCIMMGQCGTNPLPTLASVGENFVSGVCKAADIVKKDLGLEWGSITEIPFRLRLPNKFKFHSQFACPLTKESMVNGFNLPIALTCGHVMSLQHLIYLTSLRPSLTELRCLYCPIYSLHEECKTVYF